MPLVKPLFNAFVLGLVLASIYPTIAVGYFGSTPGTFKVTDDGEATYKIPLRLPPAAHGYGPHLALGFSSHKGSANSFGVGFHLKGLTHISRCPSTLTQHGVVRGILYDAKDKFCLGGELLVAYNGSYGADGTEYRTEVDMLSKIISVGDGPDHFEVWTREGEKLIFGGTSSSKMSASNKPNTTSIFSLSSRYESTGNYITYEYNQDVNTGSSSISEIAYTGNGNLAPRAFVRFLYDERPDTAISYVAGSMISTPKRVSQINTFVRSSNNTDTLVTQYKLAYSNHCFNDWSRISTISECDSAGECLPPTIFEWTEICKGASVQIDGPATSVDSGSLKLIQRDEARFHFGEFNGDGVTDILYVQGTGGTSKSIIYANNNEMKFTEAQGPSFTIGSTPADITNDLRRVIVEDMNGDGISDIVYITSSGPKPEPMKIYLSCGDAEPFKDEPIEGPPVTVSSNIDMVSLDLSRIGFADFNGDGLMDVHVLNGYGNSQAGTLYINEINNGKHSFSPVSTPALVNVHTPSARGSFDIGRVRIVDLNGDKLADFYVVTGWGSSEADMVYLNQGQADNGDISFATFSGPTTTINSVLVEAWIDLDRIQLVDIQGDGAKDVYVITYSDAPSADQVFIGYGNGTFDDGKVVGGAKTILRKVYAKLDLAKIRMVDANADGMCDVLCISCASDNGETSIFFGSGETFGDAVPGPALNISKSIPQAMTDLSLLKTLDMTGNGMLDIYKITVTPITSSSSTDVIYVSPLRAPALTLIKDGIGASIEIDYQPMNNASVHRIESHAAYPLHNVPSPGKVVALVTKRHGGGGPQHVKYVYTDRKAQVRGVGDLGFAQMVSIHVEKGIVTETTFDQQWETRTQHKVLHVVHSIGAAGTIILRRSRSWASSKRVNQKDATIFNITSPFELEESFAINGKWMRNRSTQVLFDSYNNILLSRKSTAGPSVSENIIERNTYRNDLKKWFLGQKIYTNITTSVAGKPSISTTMAWTHDPDTGLLASKITEPATPSLTYIEAYTMDRFGNTILTTLSGKGLESRNNTVIHDPSGRFITSASNALGHVSLYEHDEKFGHVLWSLDSNKLKTSHTYDGLGRRLTTTRADGSMTEKKMESYNCKDREDCVYSLTVTDACGIPMTNIYDSAGRIIRKLKFGVNGGQVVTQDYFFNNIDQLDRVSHPYFQGETQRFYTHYSYDIVERPLLTTFADKTTVSRAYDGYLQSVTNRLGQISTKLTNVLGQAIWSQDQAKAKVNFKYDSLGRLVQTTDDFGNSIFKTYDLLGRTIRSEDPDMGVTDYSYDRFGQMVSVKDASGRSQEMIYDRLGRRTATIANNGDTKKFIYDEGLAAIGKLSMITESSGVSQKFFYNSLGQEASVEYDVEGVKYNSSKTYDKICSRVSVETDPGGFSVLKNYERGFIKNISNPGNGRLYYELNDATAKGQVRQQTYGNSVTNLRDYDSVTNQVTCIRSHAAAAPEGFLQYVNYSYDNVGNVQGRFEQSRYLKEKFEYDNLNRVKSSHAIYADYESNLETVDYDSLGNLISKHNAQGTTNYTYGGHAGPHAVTKTTSSSGTVNYIYDKAGRMTGKGETKIGYDSFGRTSNLTTPDNTFIRFVYGPHDNLLKRETFYADKSRETIVMIGRFTEKTSYTKTGTISKLCRRRVHNIAILSDNCQAPLGAKEYYISRDRIGSVDVISNEHGIEEEQFRHSFSTWGRRRNATTWMPSKSMFEAEITEQGFADKLELYDANQLVYMGRMYDPSLKRFLTPDPTVQTPHYVQSYNRYTYVVNNPLALTDPSGLSFFGSLWHAITSFVKSIFHDIANLFTHIWHDFVNAIKHSALLRAVISAALNFIPGCQAWCTAMVDAAWSTLETKMEGGSWGDALLAGAESFASSAVGSAFKGVPQGFGSAKQLGGDLARGMAQGDLSAMEGHGFASGFVGGTLGSVTAGGSAKNLGGQIEQTIESGVVGGLTSMASGGSFESGFENSAISTGAGYAMADIKTLFQPAVGHHPAANKHSHHHSKSAAGHQVPKGTLSKKKDDGTISVGGCAVFAAGACLKYSYSGGHSYLHEGVAVGLDYEASGGLSTGKVETGLHIDGDIGFKVDDVGVQVGFDNTEVEASVGGFSVSFDILHPISSFHMGFEAGKEAELGFKEGGKLEFGYTECLNC